jgi:uncharacterized Zn-binding protein involved in type VI secretion
MPNVIVEGDQTSHGGVVVSASGTVSVGGKQVARKGDACTCPINGHGPCTIAEGDPNDTIDGIPVAYAGHKTTCGATLIASVSNCGKS